MDLRWSPKVKCDLILHAIISHTFDTFWLEVSFRLNSERWPKKWSLVTSTGHTDHSHLANVLLFAHSYLGAEFEAAWCRNMAFKEIHTCIRELIQTLIFIRTIYVLAWIILHQESSRNHFFFFNFWVHMKEVQRAENILAFVFTLLMLWWAFIYQYISHSSYAIHSNFPPIKKRFTLSFIFFKSALLPSSCSFYRPFSRESPYRASPVHVLVPTSGTSYRKWLSWTTADLHYCQRELQLPDHMRFTQKY